MKEAQVAEKSRGPLRDHRCLCLNLDDYLRCCHVPSKKDANFRDMPGVLTHKDGARCCDPPVAFCRSMGHHVTCKLGHHTLEETGLLS